MDYQGHSSTPATDSNGRPTQELRREIVEFVKMVVWFLLLFFVLKSFVIEGYEVQGPSMQPTLQSNERILVFKLPHILSQYRLFSGIEAIRPDDIVVFDSPDDGNKRYVKRVIAKGPPAKHDGNTVTAQHQFADIAETGVEVSIEDGRVYVDNNLLTEEYLYTDSQEFSERPVHEMLGPGDYFVMGDHRSVSKDSRSFGTIEDDEIIGKAVLRFWPLNKFALLP